MSKQTPPPIPVPSFDQIVKGNVSIEKKKDRYIITFSKIGKFLMYQVWDKDNVNNINDKRVVQYVSAKNWVNFFKEYNTYLNENNKPLFTPTTIMEMEDESVYAFVIRKAYINSSGHVVFTISTKEISPQNNTSKKLIQLPKGNFNNARFDIDNWDDLDFCSIVNFSGACSGITIKPKYSTNINFYFNDYPLKNCSINIPVFPEIQTNPSQVKVKYIKFYKNQLSFTIDVDLYKYNDIAGYIIYNNSNYTAQDLKDFMDNFSPQVDRTNDIDSVGYKGVFRYKGIQINFDLLDSNKNSIYNYYAF